MRTGDMECRMIRHFIQIRYNDRASLLIGCNRVDKDHASIADEVFHQADAAQGKKFHIDRQIKVNCCLTSSATFQPIPSSPRMGFPRPITIVFIRKERRARKAARPSNTPANPSKGGLIGKLFDQIHQFTCGITNGDFQRHLPGQGMGSASKTWIVGAKRHLDHVEQALGHLPSLIRLVRSLMRGHLDRRVVIGSPYDEICLGHDPALIGPVVMRRVPRGASTMPIPSVGIWVGLA